MNHKTDMKAALQACVDAMLHDGVPTDPEHPKRIALNAAESALASRPDAQADERGAWNIDSRESRSAFRNYDSIAEPVSGKTPWQIWRDACAWQARALLAKGE